MQAKLLRVLEEGEVERVGGDKPIKVNVRVIVATHRNLEDLVKKNEFRRDLFHRIYVFPLSLPLFANARRIFPLSSPTLLARSPHKMAGRKNSLPPKPSPNCAAIPGPAMSANCATSSSASSSSPPEKPSTPTTSASLSLPPVLPPMPVAIDGPQRQCAGQGTLVERTEAFERETLLAEIRRHNFHMTNVASALGLERSHLYKKCQQLGIDLTQLRNPSKKYRLKTNNIDKRSVSYRK